MALQSTITLPLIHSIFNVRQQRKGARMRLSIAITALFVTILIAALVQAESKLAAQSIARSWTINGSSCVPGDPAIQNNRYLVTAGTVTYQATATGLITLYCPITFPTLVGGGIWSELNVTYADTDGTGTGANNGPIGHTDPRKWQSYEHRTCSGFQQLRTDKRIVNGGTDFSHRKWL